MSSNDIENYRNGFVKRTSKIVSLPFMVVTTLCCYSGNT